MSDNRNIGEAQGALVLVTENNPVARMSLSDLLRAEGYRVLEAATHQMAIEHINRNPNLCVILADLDIPRWPLVISYARVSLPNAFVLTMARYGSMASVKDAEKLGAHGYFMKPLDFVDVHQTIAGLLTGKPKK
ncbi:MAG TPA: response regulator [Terriglobales bacterium]|nr:response regulator [Terriglobales bacterium]